MGRDQRSTRTVALGSYVKSPQARVLGIKGRRAHRRNRQVEWGLPALALGLVVPLVLARGASQASIAQAALLGTVIHLFGCLAGAAVTLADWVVRQRLLAMIVAVMTVGLTVTGLVSYGLGYRSVNDRVDRELRQEVDSLSTLQDRLENDPATIERLWNPVVAQWYEGKQDPKMALLRFDVDNAKIWLSDLEGFLKPAFNKLLGRKSEAGMGEKVAEVSL